MLKATPKAGWNSSTKLPCSKPAKSATSSLSARPPSVSPVSSSPHSTHQPIISPAGSTAKHAQGTIHPGLVNTTQRASTANTRRPTSTIKPRTSTTIRAFGEVSSVKSTHPSTGSGVSAGYHSPYGHVKPKSKSSHQDMVVKEYQKILETKNTSDREMRESLKLLRNLILIEGIPNTPRGNNVHGCDLRGRVWKALMGIYRISALEYTTLVQRGSCSVAEKIQNDTFRTLMTDKSFQSRVSNDMLTRILSAFVWKAQDQPPSRLINMRFSYVQGMNVLAAPFLYVLPELDAFYAFNTFIHNSCPLYVQPALEGVHCGIKLLDRCLEEIDSELYDYLKSKQLTAAVYAFPSIMTFSACTPPLDQVLHLWDFFLAYGVHLNIICTVSQVIHIKRDLMASLSPMKLLRSFPELNAQSIIATAKTLIPLIPEDLYDMLVRHTFDPIVCEMLLQENEDIAIA